MNALGGDFSFGTDFKKKLAEEKAAVGVKGKGDKGWENTLAGKIDAGKHQAALANMQAISQKKTKEEYEKAMEAARGSTDPKMIAALAEYDDKREFDRAKMPDHTLPPEEKIAGLKFEELAPKGSFDLPKNMDFSKASIPGLDAKDFAKVQIKQVQLAGKMATEDSKYYRDSVALDKQIEINTRDLKKTNSVASNTAITAGQPNSKGHGAPLKFALGEWMVPRDMPASIHKGEMIIPAKESAAIRELFGQSTSGRMQGTNVFNNLGSNKNQGSTAKINNITITQTFNGKQTAQAGTQMKSAASELAVKLTVLGD